MEMDPQVMKIFCMDQLQRLINQFKTVGTSKKYLLEESDQIKPHPLLNTILCTDWEPRLKAYLDLVDRITEKPLSYVTRDSVAPTLGPNEPILKQYVLMYPHHGPVYQEDNMRFFNISRELVNDIQVVNTNVEIFQAQSYGQGLVMKIATHYKG